EPRPAHASAEAGLLPVHRRVLFGRLGRPSRDVLNWTQANGAQVVDGLPLPVGRRDAL
ncbi:unnamed protein product, partial [Musa acuminata subsp. burmannicoides]